MKQKFILLDIDNTLYDSSSFRKKLFQNVVTVLEKKGIDRAAILCETIHANIMSEKGLFYPEDFVDELVRCIPDIHISKEELLDVMYDESHISSYLYQEAEELIKEFKKLGELGIFSQGMERFQKLKIKRIADMFTDKHIHIVTSKTASLGKVFEKYQTYKVFFLDDALPVLYEASRAYPQIFTIWVKRGKYAQNQKPFVDFTPTVTVSNLKEAEKIIQEQ